jgi:hypothetical protein
VVNVGLGKHGVILELAFAERRSIAGDDNEFRLARSEGFEG